MRPNNLAEARCAKAMAELMRGAGDCPPFDYPVDLEPPFAPFQPAKLNGIDLAQLGYDEPYDGRSFFQKLVDLSIQPPPVELYWPKPYRRVEPVAVVPIVLPLALDNSNALAEQLLAGITTSEPCSFEIVATGESIAVQLACPQGIAPFLSRQMELHYPGLACLSGGDADLLHDVLKRPVNAQGFYYYDYCLKDTHFHPIAMSTTFKTDPLAVALSALSSLHHDDWAIIQILWQKTRSDWVSNIRLASRDEFAPDKSVFEDYPDLGAIEGKLSRPLVAGTVRFATSSASILEALERYLSQFSAPLNGFERCADPDQESTVQTDRILGCLLDRLSYRFGMLLNVSELARIAHLPCSDIYVERLVRLKKKTFPVSQTQTNDGLFLGYNQHRGNVSEVRLSSELRNQHVYIIGATRTGKSTLMLNMILQDIEEGRGIAVVDPHGDLIVEGILPRIPEQRISDVVYFNPDDREYPIAFNPLQVQSGQDSELLCNDLVTVFHRLFVDSWGPRLEHLLRFLLLTLLSRENSTLRDVRRLIDDAGFREEVIPSISDPEIVAFWGHEFAGYNQTAFAPIRNKLGKFLAYPTVRNMLLQKENRIDFGSVMNEGGLLLCNLSQGRLGEETSYILGALIVSRLQIAAVERAYQPAAQRRDFYLYVDEFQNYVTSSFEKILSEAGKYRLNLILAHQFLKQLPERLQSAVLDNVGTIISFRTGVDVAQRLARELGEFSVQDIVSLDRGETIVRMGTSKNVFNMTTEKPPVDIAGHQAIADIIAHNRKRYARPRADIESLLPIDDTPKLDSMDDFYE